MVTSKEIQEAFDKLVEQIRNVACDECRTAISRKLSRSEKVNIMNNVLLYLSCLQRTRRLFPADVLNGEVGKFFRLRVSDPCKELEGRITSLFKRPKDVETSSPGSQRS